MKIAIITSGGDSPGMNPCIADIVMGAYERGYQTYCFYGGYPGIRDNLIRELSPRDVRGWHRIGGTNIRSDRLPELKTPEMQRHLAEILKKNGIDALIVLGGDGSFRGAKDLSMVDDCTSYIGIPCTIDNDIWGSDYTLGFDTALNKMASYIADVTDTAISMYPRAFVIETLGGKDSYFARAAVEMGICDFALTHDEPMEAEEIGARLKTLIQERKMGYALISAAEDYKGLLETIQKVREQTGFSVKYNNIAYQQRGGSPTARELIHASGFAKAALDAVAAGARNKYVIYHAGEYGYRDFSEVKHKKL